MIYRNDKKIVLFFGNLLFERGGFSLKRNNKDFVFVLDIKFFKKAGGRQQMFFRTA